MQLAWALAAPCMGLSTNSRSTQPSWQAKYLSRQQVWLADQNHSRWQTNSRATVVSTCSKSDLAGTAQLTPPNQCWKRSTSLSTRAPAQLNDYINVYPGRVCLCRPGLQAHYLQKCLYFTVSLTGTKVSTNIDQGKKNVLHCLFFFNLISGACNKRSFHRKNSTMLDYIPHACGCLPWMGLANKTKSTTMRWQFVKTTQKTQNTKKKVQKTFKKHTVQKTQLIGKASAFQHVLSSPNALQRKPRRFIATHQGMCLLYYSHRRWRVGCEYFLMWQLMRFWVGLRTICYIYVCSMHLFIPAFQCHWMWQYMPSHRALKVRTGSLMSTRFKNFFETQVSAQVLQFNHVRFWPKSFVDITRARAFPEFSRQLPPAGLSFLYVIISFCMF